MTELPPDIAAPGPDVEPEDIVDPPSLRKAAGFIAFAVGSIAFAVFAWLMGWFSTERLYVWRDWIEQAGAWRYVVFVAVNALAVAVGVPRTFFAMASGALFPFVVGALLSQLGAWIGSILTFFVGRALGRASVGPWVVARFPRARAVFATVEKHGLAANVLLRWAPVGHSFTTSLLMAVSHVKARDFAVGTFIGLLPYSVICALLGSAAKGDDPALRIAGSILGGVALTVFVGWWIRNRRRAHAKRA